jgi:hypothetical protein
MPVLSTLASGSGGAAGKKPGRLLVSVLHGKYSRALHLITLAVMPT